MPVPSQMFDIRFFSGIETKVDEKNVLATKLLELENATFEQPGKLTKRRGFTSLSTNAIDGNNITSGVALSLYNDELLLFSGAEMYTWSESMQRFKQKGNATSVIAASKTLVKNNYPQSNPANEVGGGYRVNVWEETKEGIPIIKYTVIDNNNDVILIHDALIDAGTNPKITFFNDTFTIAYRSQENGINVKYIELSNVFALSDAINLVTRNGGDYDLDGPGTDGYRLLVDIRDDGYIRLTWYREDYTIYFQYVMATINANGCGAFVDQRGCYYAIYGEDNKVKVSWSHTAGGPVMTSTVINTIPNLFAQRFTAYSADYGIRVFAEYAPFGSQSYLYQVWSNKLYQTGLTGNPERFEGSLGIYSKWFNYNNRYYSIFTYQSELLSTSNTALQNTYFVIDEFGNIVSRNAIGAAARRTNEAVKVPASAPNVFTSVIHYRSSLQQEDDYFFNQIGLNELTLDFDNSNQFIGYQMANTLQTVGGVVSTYDGVEFAENNFLLFPENVQLSSSAGTGVGAGTYLYRVCFESQDHYGQLVQSTPSISYSITLNTERRVHITVPTLKLTNRTKSQINVVIYRTEAGQSTNFYQVTSFLNPLVNDPDVNTVSFIDTTPDSSLINNKLLYTSDNVSVPYAAPPAASLMATFKNRIFLSGCEDQNIVYFSKVVTNGSPVNFSSFLSFRCDTGGDAITALGVLDDKLIIFKANSIYFTTITDGDFFDTPTLVCTGIGCSSPNSVAVFDGGLIFKAERGIYNLSRNLEAEYIGSPVYRYENLEINATTVDATCNQVRFVTNGELLVYDYLIKEWLVWTNLESVDSVIQNGTYYVLHADGRCRKQVNSYLDDDGYISMKFKTAWIKPDSIQGYQYARGVLILGSYKSSHTLNLEVAYDFDTTPSLEGSFNADEVIAQSVPYGSGSYGSGSYAEWIPYQAEFGLSYPRCNSIQLTVYDSNGTEGYDISALSLEIGALSGKNRLPQKSKFGVT